MCHKLLVIVLTVKTLTTQQAALLLRRVTMSEMRSLLAIKGAGNLTRAALDLKVTQPALSQQLREVEEKLNMPLFVRHRRGLEPTAAGHVMLRLASAMGVDIQLAAEELAMASREDGRSIRIGSMAVTSAGILAVALGRYATQVPDSNLVVMEGPRETLLEHLRHHRIDMFIGRLPPDETVRDLDAETLFQDGAVVVVSARHPLRKRSRVSMERLLEEDWILPAEDTSFYQQIALSLRIKGLTPPQARIHSYSMLAIPAVITTSELIGFLPTSMFASGTMSAGLQRLAVDFDWIASPVGVLTHRDRAVRSQLDGFLDVLRSVAASTKLTRGHG